MDEKELQAIADKAKDAQRLSLNIHVKVAYLDLEIAALKCLIYEQAKANTVGGMIL